MRLRVDRSGDAIYLNLSDAAVVESEEITDGVVLDFDADGHIVGVELLDPSRRTDAAPHTNGF